MSPAASRSSLLEHDVGSTFLLVEDDAAVLGMMRRVLEQGGFQVVPARGHSEALREARGRRLAALVSDVTLPGGDGRELAVELRAVWPGLPVLFVTGHDLEDEIAEGALLRKPFSPSQLLAGLSALLERPAP